MVFYDAILDSSPMGSIAPCGYEGAEPTNLNPILFFAKIKNSHTVNLSILARYRPVLLPLPSRPVSVAIPFKILARVHLPDVRWTVIKKNGNGSRKGR